MAAGCRDEALLARASREAAYGQYSARFFPTAQLALWLLAGLVLAWRGFVVYLG